MKKNFLLLISLIFSVNACFASLFWNLDVGIEELQKTNFKQALNYFSYYITFNPNDEDGYYWLAIAHKGLGDEKLSAQNFQKAYELYTQKKDVERINFNFESLSNVDDYFDMAVNYYGSGNYKEADFYADMMLKIEPKSAQAYFIKAKVAKAWSNDELAKKYLNQAIIFDNGILDTNLAKALSVNEVPQTTKETYRLYAVELYYRGKIKEAILNAEKYLALDKDIDMINFLANLYIKADYINLAQDLIKSAKEAGISNIQTYLAEAKIYDIKNYFDDEEKVLYDAYRINPNNQDILFALAEFYLKTKDYLNAKRFYENLVLVDDDFYEAYFGLVYSKLRLNDTSEVSTLIRKMTEINPESSEIQFLLGLLAECNLSLMDAFDFINQAIQKKDNPNYHFEKGKVYYIMGKYRDAIEEFKLARKDYANLVEKVQLDEYLLRSYIQSENLDEAQNIIIQSQKLDKNRIIYKYNLYKLCHLKEKDSGVCKKNFKSVKSEKLEDYIDNIEIAFDKKDLKSASKIISSGLKKYPYSGELIFQKIRLNYSLK